MILSVTLFAMTVALAGALFSRGEARAFWVGFALLGWTYLALTFTSWWGVLGRHLVGPNLFVVVYDEVHSVEGGPSGINGINGMGGGGGMGGGFRDAPRRGGGPGHASGLEPGPGRRGADRAMPGGPGMGRPRRLGGATSPAGARRCRPDGGFAPCPVQTRLDKTQ